MIEVGVVPNPIFDRDWEQIKEMLIPAAKRGNVPLLDKFELVWCIYDKGELKGACTTRVLPSEEIAEVILVGGKDYKDWTGKLSETLSKWAGLEGMKILRAYGRKGWVKILVPLGWRVIGTENGVTAYERAL